LTGDAPIVSVFEYTLLIFASVTAYILFGTVVSLIGLLGIVVIIGSGVVVAWRVQRAERLDRNERPKQSELPEHLAP
jgi:drug/metabolite transporter (DMT)-like permease